MLEQKPELVEQTLALVLKNEQDVALARDLLPHWFRKPRSA